MQARLPRLPQPRGAGVRQGQVRPAVDEREPLQIRHRDLFPRVAARRRPHGSGPARGPRIHPGSPQGHEARRPRGALLPGLPEPDEFQGLQRDARHLRGRPHAAQDRAALKGSLPRLIHHAPLRRQLRALRAARQPRGQAQGSLPGRQQRSPHAQHRDEGGHRVD